MVVGDDDDHGVPVREVDVLVDPALVNLGNAHHLRPEQEGLLRDAEIRQALGEAYYIASIGKETERAYRQRLGGDSPEELTPVELLARYLETKDTSPERLQVLLQHAQEIFRAEQ